MKEKKRINYLLKLTFFLYLALICFDVSFGWGNSQKVNRDPQKFSSNDAPKKKSQVKRDEQSRVVNTEESKKLLPNSSQLNYSQSHLIYVVKKGDTPQKIAQRFNISLKDLKSANQFRSTKLMPGQKIFIPQKNNIKIAQREISSQDNPVERSFYFHQVSKGETLYSIAKRYHVSVEELKTLNNVLERDLKPGMEIKIPSTQESDKRYLLSGDRSIQIKNLASNTLSSEQKVLTKKAIEPSPEEVSKLRESYIYHVVQQGETLYRISLLYNVPVEDIQRLNDIEGNLISVGQKLKIPYQEENTSQPFVLESPAKDLKVNEESLPSKFERNILAKNKILTPSMLSKDDELTLKRKFVEISTAYADSRYKLGGEGGGYLDCSSFVKYVFSEIGINLPRSSAQQFKVGISVDENELIPGDLVFFRTRGKNISHVGIYIGDNRFIHISSSRKRVAIDSLDDPYFKKRYAGAKRVLNGEVLEYFQDYLQKKELSPEPKLEKDKLSKATPSQASNLQEAIF